VFRALGLFQGLAITQNGSLGAGRQARQGTVRHVWWMRLRYQHAAKNESCGDDVCTPSSVFRTVYGVGFMSGLYGEGRKEGVLQFACVRLVGRYCTTSTLVGRSLDFEVGR
jgi:hypothetical protein